MTFKTTLNSIIDQSYIINPECTLTFLFGICIYDEKRNWVNSRVNLHWLEVDSCLLSCGRMPEGGLRREGEDSSEEVLQCSVIVED